MTFVPAIYVRLKVAQLWKVLAQQKGYALDAKLMWSEDARGYCIDGRYFGRTPAEVIDNLKRMTGE